MLQGVLRGKLCHLGVALSRFAADTSLDTGRQHNVCQRLMKLGREGDGWAPLLISIPMQWRGDRCPVIAIHYLSIRGALGP